MKIPGQTPLSTAGLSQEQLELFRSLWVESVEEAVAMAAAVSGNGKNETDTALRALSSGTFAAALPPNRLAILRQPRRGGVLGCLLDQQTVDAYTRDGRLRASRPVPAGAFEGRLPRAVRLFDHMPPVRNQGERGTCVVIIGVVV